MRRKILCLSDGIFTATFTTLRKSKKPQIVGLFTPQGERTVDNLDVALYRLELLEVPLEGFEILQECGLSVRIGHRRHELIG